MGRSRLLLLAGAGLVLGLVAVEGVVRLRQWMRYGTTHASYYDFAKDERTGLRIPKPGYRIGPIAVNSLGFRGEELAVPKPPGRIRIAFLGASTTFCAEASSLESTWPHQVVTRLRAANPGVDLDYVNGSAGGFTLENNLRNLEHRIAPLEPDVIVFYEATNDLKVDTQRLAIRAGLLAPPQADEPKAGTPLLSFYLIKKNLLRLWRSRGASEALRFEPRELSRGYEERLTRFARAAKELAPVVALVTFSVQPRVGQSPERLRSACASSLYYMPFLDAEGLLAGYAEYNRVLRAVAAAEGTLLIEGEEGIPGDAEHFADTVHFRDPGLRLQAERVLQGLLAAPTFRELLSRRSIGAGNGAGN
jgi:lysophospholipase L1-like esterase